MTSDEFLEVAEECIADAKKAENVIQKIDLVYQADQMIQVALVKLRKDAAAFKMENPGIVVETPDWG